MSHSEINPAIHYWGTPVVLITTVNEDGTYNVAPMSSAWWLGTRCMLGISGESQTTINLLRTGQCVLNLASDNMTVSVNALARTTGTPIVPPGKIQRGYRYVQDKFAAANLHPQPSTFVSPPRVQECPVQMEAELCEFHGFLDPSLPQLFAPKAIEVKILKTYVLDEIRLAGYENRIDPDKWKPLIMMFQNLYGLKNGKADDSVLARCEEELYRLPPEQPNAVSVKPE
ncbi:uncharacterized protein MYCFIDRAFT_133576 [Pseudocercospora fijiensis CIRAD86]|uniref:Flavin reductase like domain-containing protein n=1 Tax=Pseudocercospora fijiensis (strain CIRAD86) TaxID=383855 RepID=M3AHP3_PSEFD|nr:uncharacterized protein MYCFIDRAFT_133576 [Pseudocercospora fijiensis CIRAD86]EME84106.1 hypothetical protein MYCFIDRAFT_133576 [Pseudocercospora fijiensis CIRAD86]